MQHERAVRQCLQGGLLLVLLLACLLDLHLGQHFAANIGSGGLTDTMPSCHRDLAGELAHTDVSVTREDLACDLDALFAKLGLLLACPAGVWSHWS